MQKGSIIAVAIVISFSVIISPVFMSSASAEDKVIDGKDAMNGTGKSLTEAAGQLRSDANQTKEAAKALDLEKTKKGAGDVKEDVKGLKGSAKDMITSPMGK